MEASSVSTRDMSREEWLRYRRKGIGGSDAAAIIGKSRWKSAFSVYLDKLGMEDDQTSPVMEMGNLLEGYVAELFTRESGKKVARRNRTYTSKSHPCMMANIDRYVVGEQAGLECKTTTRYNSSDWDAGEVPPEYYWQCMHYMAVLGYDHWYLAVLMRDSGDFRWYRIDRDQAEIDRLIEAEEDFWGLVQRRTPPPTSGLESETDKLNELYPADKANGESVDLTELGRDIQSRVELDKQIKDMSKVREALDQKIKRAMGECQLGRAGSYKVSWAAMQRCDIDKKTLMEQFPEAFRAASKMTGYRRFEIKEVK